VLFLSELLRSVMTVLASLPAEPGAEPSPLHGAAAQCLVYANGLLQQVPPAPPGDEPLMHHVPVAAQLAHLLINGGSPEGRPAGCSCSLTHVTSAGVRTCASAAPLSFRRAGMPLAIGLTGKRMPTGQVIAAALQPLCMVISNHCRGGVAKLLVVMRGGLQLILQTIAIGVMRARRQLAAGGRSPAIPSCADLSCFLGDVDPASLAVVPDDSPVVSLLVHAAWAATAIANESQACPLCMPQQLALLLEATTMFPPTWEEARPQSNALGSLSRLLFAHKDSEAPSWVPGFVQAAVPTLSAAALAAARRLEDVPPAAAGGTHSPAGRLTNSVTDAISMALLLPGGVLQASERHAGVPLPRLLGAAELALRVAHAVAPIMPIGLTGLEMVQVRAPGGGGGGGGGGAPPPAPRPRPAPHRLPHARAARQAAPWTPTPDPPLNCPPSSAPHIWSAYSFMVGPQGPTCPACQLIYGRSARPHPAPPAHLFTPHAPRRASSPPRPPASTSCGAAARCRGW